MLLFRSIEMQYFIQLLDMIDGSECTVGQSCSCKCEYNLKQSTAFKSFILGNIIL